MTSTLVGYFNDFEEARRTEQDLLDAGFGSGAVAVTGQSTDGMQLSDGQYGQEGWWDRFKSAFGFGDEDRHYYDAAARRGGAVVTVRVPDDRTEIAASILERHNPIDIDESDVGGARAVDRDTTVGTDLNATSRAGLETESIPLAQEELLVGKRAVQRGALRIHTYVTETPVEEQVTLREQQAFVDRRPVNRAAEPGEAAFQERSLEVREYGEEVVVAKEARVVEEVRVGKQEIDRTETVRDSVRKTELDVEEDVSTTETLRNDPLRSSKTPKLR